MVTKVLQRFYDNGNKIELKWKTSKFKDTIRVLTKPQIDWIVSLPTLREMVGLNLAERCEAVKQEFDLEKAPSVATLSKCYKLHRISKTRIRKTHLCAPTQEALWHDRVEYC